MAQTSGTVAQTTTVTLTMNSRLLLLLLHIKIIIFGLYTLLGNSELGT